MKILSYEPDQLSPGVLFNKDSGLFIISGVSCPEDALEFYDPIFDWLDSYIQDPLETTVLEFRMSYFNSVSAKIFLMIMTKMEDLSEMGYDVKIKWYFEEGEDDLEEAGEEFENIVDLDFEIYMIQSTTDISKDDEYFDNMMSDLL